MKKAIVPLLLIASLAYIGYMHKDYTISLLKKIKKDPAEVVLNANLSLYEIIDTFYNETY